MKRRRRPTPFEVAAVRALDLHAPLPSPNSDAKRQRGLGAAADGPESDSTSGPCRDRVPAAPDSSRPASETDNPDTKDDR